MSDWSLKDWLGDEYVERPKGLPEPLQSAANAMHDAKSEDEAAAAARTYLQLLCEEFDLGT